MDSLSFHQLLAQSTVNVAWSVLKVNVQKYHELANLGVKPNVNCIVCQFSEVGHQKQKMPFVDWLVKYIFICLPADQKALVEELRVIGSGLEGDVVQDT